MARVDLARAVAAETARALRAWVAVGLEAALPAEVVVTMAVVAMVVTTVVVVMAREGRVKVAAAGMGLGSADSLAVALVVAAGRVKWAAEERVRD